MAEKNIFSIDGRKQFQICFLVVIAIILNCCNQNKVQKFSREIPPNEQKGPELFADIQRNCSLMQLDLLDSGYKSMQIRIWYSVAMSRRQQVLILKNNGEWGGEFYDYLPVLNSTKDSVLRIESNKRKISPACTWDSLINKLFDNEVMTLPNYHIFKNYSLGTDGDQYTFEVSTPHSYRLYYYPQASVNIQLPEARKVMKIIEIINKEMGITLGSIQDHGGNL